MTKQHKGGPQTADGRPPLERADEILEEIRTLQGGIDFIRRTVEVEMEEVRKRHQKSLDLLLEELAINENAIRELMKKEKATIFEGEDRVELINGILLYSRDIKLKIPRDALEKIEGWGWTEAIRIAKSIDRAAVEKWPDDRLAMIGAIKKVVESFNYEILPEGEKEGR